jgi:hypothetical protein
MEIIIKINVNESESAAIQAVSESLSNLMSIQNAQAAIPAHVSNALPTNDIGSLEQMVTEVLSKIGMPRNLKGFKFIREAVMLLVEDFSKIDRITKDLYPTIASKFHTTPTRVERAMRHAIENTWNTGDMESIFVNTINPGQGKPTNSEFLALLADDIRIKRAGSNN